MSKEFTRGDDAASEVARLWIPTTLKELVDPRHTVVLLIDPQKNIVLGMRPETMFPKMVANLVPFLEAARKAGMRIIYTIGVGSPHNRSAVEWYGYMKLRGTRDPNKIYDAITEGTETAVFLDEVKPKQEDIVIKKCRRSAFVGTPLDIILRNYGTKTLIVAGLATDGCVESTVRDAAYSHDYFLVLVEDCLASQNRENHDAMMVCV